MKKTKRILLTIASIILFLSISCGGGSSGSKSTNKSNNRSVNNTPSNSSNNNIDQQRASYTSNLGKPQASINVNDHQSSELIEHLKVNYKATVRSFSSFGYFEDLKTRNPEAYQAMTTELERIWFTLLSLQNT